MERRLNGYVTIIGSSLRLEVVITVTAVLIISGKEDATAHDVTLVAFGTEGGSDTAAHEDFAVVSVIGDGASIPSGMAVFGVVFACQPDGNITSKTRIDNLKIEMNMAEVDCPS